MVEKATLGVAHIEKVIGILVVTLKEDDRMAYSIYLRRQSWQGVTMKTFTRLIGDIGRLVYFLMFGLLTNVNAEVIEVPMNGATSGFGDPNWYVGQTFIAPQRFAEELTVFVGESNATPGPVTYHILITEVDEIEYDGAYLPHPTTVLFESGPLVTNIGYGMPPPITVSLGMLPLTAGEKYAWILDAYVEIDNNPPLNPGGPYPSALVGVSGMDYSPEIESISYPLGPFPSGTREEHFSDWWPVDAYDHAFTITFAENYETIDLDIQPNKTDNKIRLDDSALVPVAILSNAYFDARLVDAASVQFGPNAAEPVERLTRFKDVNKDGYIDLYLRFVATETGIECEDTEATLTGIYHDADDTFPIIGTDSFTVRHCK